MIIKAFFGKMVNFWLESLYIFLPSQSKFWLIVLKTIKDFYTSFYAIISLGVALIYFYDNGIVLRFIILLLLGYYQVLVCNAVKSTVKPKQNSYIYIKDILIKSFSLVLILALVMWACKSSYILFVNSSLFAPCHIFFFLDSKLFSKPGMNLAEKAKSMFYIFYNSLLMQFYNLPFFLVVYSIFLLIASEFLLFSVCILPIYYSIVSNFYIKNRYEHFNLYKEA